MSDYLDSNSVLRAASLTDYPAEAVAYAPGDEVLVWTKGSKDERDNFERAVVTKRSKTTGNMNVRTEKGDNLEYGSGVSKRGRFTVAVPKGPYTKRSTLRVYSVDRTCYSTNRTKDARNAWNFLFVGPGSRPIGELLAVKLGCLPDADESNLERYWLYLPTGLTKEDACNLVSEAAKKCIWTYICLQSQIESLQELHLRNTGDGSYILDGPCSTALIPALKQFIGMLGYPQLNTKTSVAYSKRESVHIRGPLLSRQTACDAILQCLDCAHIPRRLLNTSNDTLLCTLKRNANLLGWKCTEEGPAARYAHIVKDSQDGYSCPANILAVHGPQQEALCLLNFARFHAEIPTVKNAEIECAAYPSEVGQARCPSEKAALTWALHDSDNGPWLLKKIADDDSDKQYCRDIMNQWSARNIKRILEGELASVRPMQCLVEIRLTDALDFIEYTDFKTLDKTTPLPRLGWCGLINPAEWIEDVHAVCRVRLTIAVTEGIAFARAQSRPTPRVRLNAKALLSSTPTQRQKLAQGFVSSYDHVGLPDLNGQQVTRPTPLHVCASGHPEANVWSRVATQKVVNKDAVTCEDIEDVFSSWMSKINDAERPCSLCMTCNQIIHSAIPGFWHISPDDTVIICSFPCSWRPLRRTLNTCSGGSFLLPITDIDITRQVENSAQVKSQITASGISKDSVDLWCSIIRSFSSTTKPINIGWSNDLLEQLEILQLTYIERTHLATIFVASAQNIKHADFDKNLNEVKIWLGLPSLPLCNISKEWNTIKGKQEFIDVLLKCARVTNLRTTMLFFFASRRISNCINRGWDSAAISEWIDATVNSHCEAWRIADSVDMLTVAISSDYPACRALHIASSTSSAKTWLDLWTSCSFEGESTIYQSKHHDLALKEANQLLAPEVGSHRWFDVHDRPEHAALILDHALRELVSSLFYIWCLDHASLQDLQESHIPGVVRGDAEYLHNEKRWNISDVDLEQRCEMLLRLDSNSDAAISSKFLAHRMKDLLSHGCASTTDLTAECLPRKATWNICKQKRI